MKCLTKWPLIALLFLGILLWFATSHSVEAGCSCCLPNECQCGYSTKMHTEELSPRSESPEEGSHCHCKQCKNRNHQETFFLTPNSTLLQGKQSLTLRRNISDGTTNLLNVNINVYSDNSYTSNFFPLFLLKASFLL